MTKPAPGWQPIEVVIPSPELTGFKPIEVGPPAEVAPVTEHPKPVSGKKEIS